jgi:hypothetical protein
MQYPNYLRLLIPVVFAMGLSFPVIAESPVEDIASQYAALEQSGSESPQDWLAVATAARSAGDLELATKALDTAARYELPPVRVGLERARIYVAGGHSAKAVAALQEVADLGFTSVSVLTSDPVINSLAGHSGYDSLVAQMSVQAYPCAHMDGFGDFDFWLGSWDVHVANGTLVGTNTIEREERGCVLIERWKNSSGGTGMSVNYLDKATDEWVQVWNAEGGSQINIRGGLTADGMRMEGQLHTIGNGTTVPFRALWTPLPDGRVRQFFEQSNDDGETWVAWFEGFYSRAK